MKKILGLILTFCLAIALLPGRFVFAEPEAPFTFHVVTQNGSEPVLASAYGYKLNLDFLITAQNGTFGSSVTFEKIDWTLGNFSVDTTVSAEESSIVIPHDIVFNKIYGGKTVTFKLYWHTDEHPDPAPVTFDLMLIEEHPDVTIRATVGETSVVPGSDVTILYEAKNVGNVPVQFVEIYDEGVTDILPEMNYIDKMVKVDEYLQPGASLSKEVTVKLDSTLKINPHIKYTYETVVYEATSEETQISVNEVVPSVSLKCDNYSVANKGDSLHFTYSIQNKNIVPLLNIRVFDSDSADGEPVKVIDTLAPEDKYEGEFDAVITRSGFYKFKIKYTYEGADDDLLLSAKTERSIRIPSEITFRVTGVTPSTISEPGDLFITLTIENAGSAEMTDLTITEENNLMDTLSTNVIIPGYSNGKNGELTRVVTVHIPADGTKLKFNLGYRIDGEYATTNVTYTVDFDQPFLTPEPTDTTPAPTDKGNGFDLLIWIMVGILLLILIAGTITLLLILRRRANPENNHPVRRHIDPAFDEQDEADYLYNDPEESYDEVQDETPDEADADTDDEGVKIYRKSE